MTSYARVRRLPISGVARALLAVGADPTIADEVGCTALHVAVEHCNSAQAAANMPTPSFVDALLEPASCLSVFAFALCAAFGRPVPGTIDAVWSLPALVTTLLDKNGQSVLGALLAGSAPGDRSRALLRLVLSCSAIDECLALGVPKVASSDTRDATRVAGVLVDALRFWEARSRALLARQGAGARQRGVHAPDADLSLLLLPSHALPAGHGLFWERCGIRSTQVVLPLPGSQASATSAGRLELVCVERLN